MLPCLRRALRPALSLRAGTGLAAAGLGEHHAPAPRWPLEQRRALGTHPLNETVEPLNSPRGAKEFIYTLHPSERTCLLRELHKFESIAIAQGQVEVAPPTSAELKYVLLHNAIPFVGFGFLDNCIMIVAGTHIELSIGVVLGISTMAAAALGNLVSDLAGLGNYIGHPGFIKDAIHRAKIGASAIHRAKIGASTITDLLAGYVEALAYRLGMQIPDLSPKQADMWQTRVSSHAGKAIGVAIGCILGMFPLFFLNDDDEKKKAQKEAKEKTQPQPTLAPTESGKN